MTRNFQSPLLLPLYLPGKLQFSSEKHSSWYLMGVRSFSWCWLMFLEAWRKVQSILIHSRDGKGRQKSPVGGTHLLLHQCSRLLLCFGDSAGNIIQPFQVFMRPSCLIHVEKTANILSAIRWVYQDYESQLQLLVWLICSCNEANILFLWGLALRMTFWLLLVSISYSFISYNLSFPVREAVSGAVLNKNAHVHNSWSASVFQGNLI